MPAKSEAQRRLIYGKFGKEFAERHHFDNKGKLPEKVEKDSIGRSNVGLALYQAQVAKRKSKK